MPKLGVEPKRRSDVINATLTCICKYGIDGLTLDKVAEQANCSKGVVTYYYKSKDDLLIEALKAFMAYFGSKIESEINSSMTASDMLETVMKYILPVHSVDGGKDINVSQLEGVEKMFISYEDLPILFVQFFSKASSDHRFQKVIAESYMADLQGIVKILEYGNKTSQMRIDDPESAAYGFFAMVVGLSFFRVAKVPPMNGEDNRYLCQNYVKQLSARIDEL